MFYFVKFYKFITKSCFQEGRVIIQSLPDGKGRGVPNVLIGHIATLGQGRSIINNSRVILKLQRRNSYFT